MLYCPVRMPIVFIVARDWALRTGVRAELRERQIEALGMESAADAGGVLANGQMPAAVVLEASTDAAKDPAFFELAGRVPVVIIASRTESAPLLPAAQIFYRPVRVGEVVDCVCRLLRGTAA